MLTSNCIGMGNLKNGAHVLVALYPILLGLGGGVRIASYYCCCPFCAYCIGNAVGNVVALVVASFLLFLGMKRYGHNVVDIGIGWAGLEVESKNISQLIAYFRISFILQLMDELANLGSFAEMEKRAPGGGINLPPKLLGNRVVFVLPVAGIGQARNAFCTKGCFAF